MTKGGVMILATWLSQASAEEQTSVLSIILEVEDDQSHKLNCTKHCKLLKLILYHLQVLSHLPLHKALPSQLSAVLQTVNRLRFYRTSGVLLLIEVHNFHSVHSRWLSLVFAPHFILPGPGMVYCCVIGWLLK